MSEGTERYGKFSFESSSENLKAVAAALAYDRALAWARSAAGTLYGGTEVVRDAPRGTHAERGSGAVPDLPDQTIPRLRGGDACG